MADRILLCGLNGCGKSTVGAILARRLGYVHMDIEDFFFPLHDPVYKYASQRPLEEVKGLLLQDLSRYDKILFSAVKGDYGPQVEALFDRAVYLYAPKQLRLERIRSRSREKFGQRMEPNGDLYDQEEAFFQMAAAREENSVLSWLEKLHIPVLRVDAAQPLLGVVETIQQQL